MEELLLKMHAMGAITDEEYDKYYKELKDSEDYLESIEEENRELGQENDILGDKILELEKEIDELEDRIFELE
ncbi:MAG: hypothetical protein ACRC9H_14920 [Aeromonas veronii]